jgi:hypothetical protein
MTGAQFRKAALALEGAEEKAHMDHPDFRANGRIFATLSNGETRGMVKIPVELQATMLEDESGAFTPAAGAWGRAGSTLIDLAKAPAALVKSLLHEAWTLSRAAPAPRRPAQGSARKASAASPRRRTQS